MGIQAPPAEVPTILELLSNGYSVNTTIAGPSIRSTVVRSEGTSYTPYVAPPPPHAPPPYAPTPDVLEPVVSQVAAAPEPAPEGGAGPGPTVDVGPLKAVPLIFLVGATVAVCVVLVLLCKRKRVKTGDAGAPGGLYSNWN